MRLQQAHRNRETSVVIETQLAEARSQVRDLERELERIQADHLQVVSVEWEVMRRANTVWSAYVREQQQWVADA